MNQPGIVMQSSRNQEENDIQVKFTKAYDCIYQNNNEIQKQATILIRLIKSIEADRLLLPGYDNIAKKIGKKLKKHLELWKVYNRNISEDSMAYNEELESVMKEREILIVKKKIGDICDEKEYNVKLGASNWDIDNLKLKKSHLEKKINLLNSLHAQIEPEVANSIKMYSQDNYKKIDELELDTEISEILIDDIEIIARIISKVSEHEPHMSKELLTHINY